jgi:exopolysaccharide production protein ExoZ
MHDKTQPIWSLQYLRAIAALAVALSHAAQIIPVAGRNDFIPGFPTGAAGVDIFFIVSGYIICLITSKSESNASLFFRRRLARVAPTYWVITAAISLAILYAPFLFRTSTVTWELFVSSLVFVAWPNPATGDAQPVLLIGWTLNYEFYFYSLFAICMLFFRNRAYIAAAALIIVLTAALSAVPSGNAIATFYGNTIVFEFLGGILLWRLQQAGRLGRPGLGISLFLLSIFLFVMSEVVFEPTRTSQLRFIYWGLPSFFLVWSALCLEANGKVPRLEIPKVLGDASYSIYLSHIITLGAVRYLWAATNAKVALPDIALLVIAIGACTFTGWAFYRIVEVPICRLARRAIAP